MGDADRRPAAGGFAALAVGWLAWRTADRRHGPACRMLQPGEAVAVRWVAGPRAGVTDLAGVHWTVPADLLVPLAPEAP